MNKRSNYRVSEHQVYETCIQLNASVQCANNGLNDLHQKLMDLNLFELAHAVREIKSGLVTSKHISDVVELYHKDQSPKNQNVEHVDVYNFEQVRIG